MARYTELSAAASAASGVAPIVSNTAEAVSRNFAFAMRTFRLPRVSYGPDQGHKPQVRAAEAEKAEQFKVSVF